jgi:hypothetical protein
MTIIWKWIQKTNYNEALVFNGNRKDLHELLHRLNTVRIRMVNDDEIKVLAIVSLGVGWRVTNTQRKHHDARERAQSGSASDQYPDQDALRAISLGADIILILISIISEGGKLWEFFLALALWPVTHWWFHLWHRAQENDLYNLMVKKLRLRSSQRLSLSSSTPRICFAN